MFVPISCPSFADWNIWYQTQRWTYPFLQRRKQTQNGHLLPLVPTASQIQILENLQSMEIHISVSVELHGGGNIPYAFIWFLCIHLLCLIFRLMLEGSDHLHLQYTLPNLHSDSFLCAHNINKSADNCANNVHRKGKSCVLVLVLLHHWIRITESEDVESIGLEKTPKITESSLVILTMPTNDASWLLRWGFFSFGAGDPLAKTWKQPEFPCNKAAVRKAQSN